MREWENLALVSWSSAFDPQFYDVSNSNMQSCDDFVAARSGDRDSGHTANFAYLITLLGLRGIKR